MTRVLEEREVMTVRREVSAGLENGKTMSELLRKLRGDGLRVLRNYRSLVLVGYEDERGWTIEIVGRG